MGGFKSREVRVLDDLSLQQLLEKRQELQNAKGKVVVHNHQQGTDHQDDPQYRKLSGEIGEVEWEVKRRLGQDTRLPETDTEVEALLDKPVGVHVEANQRTEQRIGGTVIRDTDGREYRAYRHDERIAERSPSIGMREVGRIIQGMYQSDLASVRYEVEELRALGGGIDASGGILIPSEVSGMLIDEARSASVLSKAGMLSVPMGSRSLTLARVESSPDAYSKPENVAATESEATFGACVLEPYTVATFSKISDELLQDAADASIFAQVMTASLASQVDTLGLRGTGAGEPRGLRLDPNVNSHDIGGAFDLDEIITAIGEIVAANHDPAGVAAIFSPAEWVAWQQAKGGDAHYYLSTGNAPEAWNDCAKFVTSSVLDTYDGTLRAAAGSGALSEMYFGLFDRMVCGVRRAVQLRVSTEGAALQAGQAWLLASCRVDFGTLDPSAFCIGYDI